VLSNAKKFYDGASGAADAPVLGEAPIATCIDFYGTIRVQMMPEAIVYVSPAGQTAFSPDPIAILKTPPHAQLARLFVEFVLSRRGQALWALRVGEPDGPVRTPLGRQPIRKDVYAHYAGRMSPWIVDPYQEGNAMVLDVAMSKARFGVLRQLVRAAAIDNRDGMREAKRKLIQTDFAAARLEEFNRLPDNVATREDIARVAEQLNDKTMAERIVTDWQRFFRDKYRRVAE